MGNFIELKVNTKEIQTALSTLAHKTGNREPLMQDIADIMFNSIIENFRQEGRPKWPTLAPSTLYHNRNCCRL